MARTWTVTASIGATDISALITGEVAISAEENQARTATISFLPASGSYVPEDWIGAAVTINYVSSPDASPVSTRVFTGFVNWPDLDETTGVLTLNCSDLLQEYFEDLTTDAQILSVITGAKLADEVFGERDDGWQRAQDALSTVRAEVHKSRTGAVTVTNWAAKATADFVYTQSGYVHETTRVAFNERRSLVNKISLSFEYRYNRHKMRVHSWNWNQGAVFCDWVDDQFPWHPSTDMFRTAADGAGWAIVSGMSFDRFPERGNYYCGAQLFQWLGAVADIGGTYDLTAQEEMNNRLAFGASWAACKRFAQTITETYSIDVSSSGSVALFGEIPGEDSASFDVESDDSGWESSDGTSVPAGFSADAIGDYVQDQGDRTGSDNAVVCLIQHADHKIAGSHRGNYVEWQAPIEPALDLDHTAQITSPRVTAKGKVVQIGHTMDLSEGRAVTAIKIACSRGGGGAQSSLAAPTPPSTAPTHTAPDSSTGMDWYIGGTDAAADWSDAAHENESYVSSNIATQTTSNPDKIYPRRVHVVTPEIEDEARDNLEASSSPSYNVSIPDDLLSVSI